MSFWLFRQKVSEQCNRHQSSRRHSGWLCFCHQLLCPNKMSPSMSNVFGLVILIYGKWTTCSLAVDQNNKTKNIWQMGMLGDILFGHNSRWQSAAVSSTTLMTVALFADFLTKKPKWHSQEFGKVPLFCEGCRPPSHTVQVWPRAAAHRKRAQSDLLF